jgi:hypothetical protein
MKRTTIITLSALSLIAVLGFTAIVGVNAKGNRFNGSFNGSMMASMMGAIDYKNFGQMMSEIKGKFFNGLGRNHTITGTVALVSTATLEIDVKNTKYTVNVDTTNDIIVNRIWDKINLSDIKAGDIVNVFGNKTDTTIDAKLVRDLTIPPLTEITIVGKVTAISGNTLTVTVNNGNSTLYTVNIETGDILVNRIWDKINLSDIKVNDKVMVFGTATSTTINAKLVKDLSLPLTSVTTEQEENEED